jgi:hypothetical protein
MMVKIFLRVPAAFLAFLMLAGCGSGGFSVNQTLESRPVQLDGEQVVLDSGQVDCGTREDLWTITPFGDGRAAGRLTQKGRDLQFSDDVQIGDPVVGAPYVQIHGTFPVRVLRVGSVHDEDAYTKVAEANVSVRINHSCFQRNPPVLMGIRHGKFDQSASPVFRFIQEDEEWQVDHIVH